MYDDYEIKPLHIMLPKINGYVKIYEGQTKWMYFLIEDDDLLEKYNTIWNKVSADIKKEFISEPVYNKKTFENQIKSYSDKTTHFHDKEILKVDSNHTCLAVISLHYSSNWLGNYYLQVFLKRKKHCK